MVKKNIRQFIQENILILDGAMGTMLQKAGLKPGEGPEFLNIENPQSVLDVHTAYLNAGSNLVLTNTFGANSLKLKNYSPEQVISQGVHLAKQAADKFGAYTALDIGPIGELLEPMGTLDFQQAYEIFKQQVQIGVNCGVDAIYIETMTDLCEARCAVLAAKENSNLPVFCTMSFEQNMRTFMGVGIDSMALTLQGLGADFIGINCSVGPIEIYKMAENLLKWTNIPIIIKPNAGLPVIHPHTGETMFSVTPQAFTDQMRGILDLGVSIIGGCCGTDPDFIAALSQISKGRQPIKRDRISISAVCSYGKTVELDEIKIIGERINPTGKPLLRRAIEENDLDYIINEAIEQTQEGAHILDINVGVPGICEADVMTQSIKEIQAVIPTPLQIDSSDPKAIQSALRAYNGKAIVNSVNGDDLVLEQILPLVKKYGAAVIGLTLDKDGVPKTVAQRFSIAEKITAKALEYGIPREDILIDCLTLTSGAQQQMAYQALDALELVKSKLGVKTVLGVSNISFGLPARQLLNQTFLAAALAKGLDLPIINPASSALLDTIYCFRQLKNIDSGSREYIHRFHHTTMEKPLLGGDGEPPSVAHCIENGLKEDIKPIIKSLLDQISGHDATNQVQMKIVNGLLLPALDKVGLKYEKGEIFLPQLLQSAEAAKAAFDIIKSTIPRTNDMDGEKIILATVEGDVHDIGKNIVKVVLENYGYNVIDLGKDVKASHVTYQAVKNHVKLVGLSALMTTTVENMEKTIKSIKDADSNILVMVGGAVLNEECAKEIGADFYAKDAMAALEIARTSLNNLP